MTTGTHAVSLINSDKYGVIGHRTGCRDIARDVKKDFHGNGEFDMDVKSKRHAYLEYNTDFIWENADLEGHWEIHWMSCTAHVPIRVEEDDALEAQITAGFTPSDEVDFDVDLPVTKIVEGRKWVQVLVDGEPIAWVLRHQEEVAIKALQNR